MNRLHRVAAAGAMTALTTLAYAGHASAHTSGASATCNGITTSLQFFENAAGDRVYTYIDDMVNPVDTFNGPFVTTTHTVPVPQDGVTHAWKVVVDSVSGNGTQYDATYNGQVGPCGEVQTTTTSTEAPTSTSTSTTLVVETTTTTAPATTTTTEPTTTSTLPDQSSTTVPSSTTTTTPATTSSSTSSSMPATSSSISPATSTTAPPSVPSTTLPPECSDNPNTPTDDCAPVCRPVTQPDGTNSCSTLPPTGFAGAVIGGIAGCLIGVGLLIGLVLRRRG